MDPAVLLQSKGDDSPSGENLEYDSVFTDMELAAQPVEGTEIGDSRTEGHEPDYREVAKKALQVLDQSHDLRAAVFLADALLHTEGLTGYADVTTLMRGMLEDYWASCHPELDEDDDDDPTMRVNAVQGLCGQPGGMAGPSPAYRSLRRAALTDSRGFGRISMRDIEVSEGQIALPDGESGPDASTIAAAFRDTDDETLAATLSALQTAADNVRAISAVFDENTPGQGPDLDDLIRMLDQMKKHLAAYTDAGDAAGADDAVMQDAAQDAPGQAGAAPAAAPGSITSRNDVVSSLDRIVNYYRQNEPSSPIPILLERAKRLVNADFMTIIEDIVPNEVDTVRQLGGANND